MSEYHNNEHQQHRDNEEANNDFNFNNNKQASAPPQNQNHSGDDNGFYVVDDKSKQSTEHTQNVADVDKLVSDVADAVNSGKEDISKILDELNESQKKLADNNINKITLAEADSSIAAASKPIFGSNVSSDHSMPVHDTKVLKPDEHTSAYYKLVREHLSKIKVPTEVKDYVLWKNPKLTGALFVGTLVLLISLACFSFLSVISTSALLALATTGCYRLYMAVMFRIKGTHDECFEKMSKCDVTIPKEKVNEIAQILQTDINGFLVQAKAILLWENIWGSILALVGFYIVYCIGSVFNTLTLAILLLVSIFTLPKVYQVYKQPIDQVFNKTSANIHKIVLQAQEKLPFLQHLSQKKKAL